MTDFLKADEFWLLFVNVVLGLTTLACVIVIGRVAYREILDKRKMRRWLERLDDDHAFVFSDLGVTMADGGERTDGGSPPSGGSHLFVSEEGLTSVESPAPPDETEYRPSDER
jgi:hypothetical protein